MESNAIASHLKTEMSRADRFTQSKIPNEPTVAASKEVTEHLGTAKPTASKLAPVPEPTFNVRLAPEVAFSPGRATIEVYVSNS